MNFFLSYCFCDFVGKKKGYQDILLFLYWQTVPSGVQFYLYKCFFLFISQPHFCFLIRKNPTSPRLCLKSESLSFSVQHPLRLFVCSLCTSRWNRSDIWDPGAAERNGQASCVVFLQHASNQINQLGLCVPPTSHHVIFSIASFDSRPANL